MEHTLIHVIDNSISNKIITNKIKWKPNERNNQLAVFLNKLKHKHLGYTNLFENKEYSFCRTTDATSVHIESTG